MKKGLRIVIIAAMVFLILGVIGLLVSEYLENGKIEQATALKAAAIIVSLLIAFAKLFLRNDKGKAAKYKKYEELYSDYIKNAFTRPEQKKDRKELLRAIDNYNLNNYHKAIEILDKLKKNCHKNSDIFAVNMFTALCYSEMGVNKKAIETYQKMLITTDENSTVWSNLGLLYLREGKNREAEECYKKAMEKNSASPYPYNNLGALYLKESRYDEAIKYALLALEKKNNMYQASNTLAIAYTVKGELDNADKYFKLSVANGVDGESLRQAINNYCENLD